MDRLCFMNENKCLSRILKMLTSKVYTLLLWALAGKIFLQCKLLLHHHSDHTYRVVNVTLQQALVVLVLFRSFFKNMECATVIIFKFLSSNQIVSNLQIIENY